MQAIAHVLFSKYTVTIMLPERCEKLWHAYVQAENVGIRSQLTETLHAFITEMRNAPDETRNYWAYDLARRVVDLNDQTVIRTPLFREILFPALRAGFRARTPGCARWLAGFAQLLYHSPGSIAELPASAKTEHGLLLHALEVDPNDGLTKQTLLKLLRSRFDYVLHELPVGILYGHDGATVEQCAELEDELRFFRTLATACGSLEIDEELLSEAEFHVREYPQYLQRRKLGDTYEKFLSQKPDKA